MNYEDMEDWQINKAVAEKLGLEKAVRKETYRDYCNDPEHAWPIIVDKKIEVGPQFQSKLWRAAWRNEENPFTWEESFPDIIAIHENPLRAAMIVFLVVNDEAKADA